MFLITLLIFTSTSTCYASAISEGELKKYLTEDGNLTQVGYEKLREISTSRGVIEDERVSEIDEILFARSELTSTLKHYMFITGGCHVKKN